MIRVCQAELYIRFAIRQMAAGANPAAAVTSASGERDDFGFLPATTENFNRQQSEIAPGVFHHLKEVWSGLFHRDAIYFPHLIGSNRGNFDACIGEKLRNHSQPPVNPALRSPSTIKGHFFINSQRNPVRWFSIIITIGP